MSTSNTAYACWRLASRPQGAPARANLRWETGALPSPAEGEARVRTLFASVDPTHRIWMSDAPQYMPPIAVGDVIRGEVLGVVEESRAAGTAPGDLVTGFWGWQTHALVGEKSLRHKLRPAAGVPLEAYLGVLGGTGLTAWFGIEDIAAPRAGETVVVSAAAGAVGSVAGQLAALRGARVIGIAGSPEKCRWIVEECGFHGAIDYRRENVGAALDGLCPKGIDVGFENVGGAMLDAVLARINVGARIALCGLIANYNDLEREEGPRQFRQVMMKRAKVQGFIVLDYARRFGEARAALEAHLVAGRLRHRSHMVDGLERAPDVLAGLFYGDNLGKAIVRL
jgi:NADPH-dependent curcumin reductase CurA